MPTPSSAPRGVVAPGRLFVDQHGSVAQLHGVGVQHLDGLFYAWGEDKAHGQTFAGVACYSSPDLATWTFRGHALAVDPAVPDLAPGRVIERPKVLRHPDGRHVMFLHVDSPDYADARVGWAVADRPEGPYTYLRSERPLGHASRDIGVFADADGTGYLLSEDRENGLHVYRLTPDYLGVEEIVSTTLTPPSDHPAGPHGYESPAMIEHDGRYYLFGSELTGWATNDNKVAWAPSPAGPWSDWADVAPPGSATYDSQTSTVVTVRGTEATTHVYVGDRWDPDDLAHSAPVWLPVRVADGAATIEWLDAWTIDPVTGLVADAEVTA
ncbi:family 43 glycosylhydrolase [Isoptericola sp. NPDC057391]|uniref:family 43 glycosylhydrolase n=1 Tax=Isoptericola sp. NPDC057391 TaxID=3346117 RepID=UPI003638B7D4